MRLRDYPRPRGDTGIGFHWIPDYWHYESRYFERLAPRLQEMGANWLVLISDLARPIPEWFLRGLIERNIEPIIRVYIDDIVYVDQQALKALCQHYASAGVHYIHIFNEPNLSATWPKWDPNGAPDRFMNFLIPCLETIYSVEGVIPVFTPLSPGGEYWDLPFLKTCFDILNQQGKRYLFSRMAVSIHNYAFNKPLTWGKGGQNRWPCAQPHRELPGCEDQLGFHLFEWYDQIIRYKVGYSLPMISTESGVLPGNQAHSAFPPIDETLHAQRSREISEVVMRGQVPNYLVNNAFWLLATEDAHLFAGHRWFRVDGSPILPRSYEALRALTKQARVPRIWLSDMIRVLMTDGSLVVMDMEEYLKGVLPAEMGNRAHPEALKAQAIAARSYAGRAVEVPRHREVGADICATTHCQVWRSTRYPETDRAVEETRGMVATYDEEIIGGYYFAQCTGHTKNSEDVWVRALPYCRSVPCLAPQAEFKGHGVGMCQRGSMAMAQAGFTALEIIGHYYTGVGAANGYSGQVIPMPARRPLPIIITEDRPLRLEEWPRPPDDNGMGIHAGPDFSDDALAHDLARIQEMGLKWVSLAPVNLGELEKALRLYWSRGILPVVRPRVKIDEEHDFGRDLGLQLAAGAPPYLQIYRAPSEPEEWSSGVPNLEIFIDRWLTQAVKVLKAGGLPGLQVQSTEELRRVIAASKARGLTRLWGRSWFSDPAFGSNRPPHYPYDEVNQKGVPVSDPQWEYAGTVEEVNRWRSEDKRPGQAIEQDYHAALGLLAFAKVFQEQLGFVPPILCVEGGWQLGILEDRRYPRTNIEHHRWWHAEVYEWFRRGTLSNGQPTPPFLFAFCPWVLSGAGPAAWYSSDRGTRQETVELVKSMRGFGRQAPKSPGPIELPPFEERPPQPTPPLIWEMSLERQAGPRMLFGSLPRAGIRVTVSDASASGGRVVAIAGSYPELGPAGIKVPLWSDGEFTIRFLDQSFSVSINSETVTATFREVEKPDLIEQGRLVSAWMERPVAETLLGELQSNERTRDRFSLETREVAASWFPPSLRIGDEARYSRGRR